MTMSPIIGEWFENDVNLIMQKLDLHWTVKTPNQGIIFGGTVFIQITVESLPMSNEPVQGPSPFQDT